ncbi:MAG TPA: DUF4253 domain-containing protein [Verrucomicrobiae bacterium]
MGFIQRFFGGDDSDGKNKTQPPPLPDFDYELIYVPGNVAVQNAIALREKWHDASTPVILGTQENFDRLTDIWDEDSPSPSEYLESAANLDLEKWFADHASEDQEDSELQDYINKASDWNTHSGAAEEFTVVREVLSRKIHPWVLIAKIPTPHPYEVPAYLRLGGWNECPDAPVHVALWKKWQHQYGAEILCVTGDIIEATVARPPTEKEECYKLAREQYLYCSDIVTQGVGTIDALASTLRAGKSWYFWWD